MRRRYLNSFALTLLILPSLLLTAANVAAEDAPADLVKQFNAAITARDMDTAMAALADGSVQLQLRAVHPGMSDTPPLTADLQKTWQTVAAILFPMSESYERTVQITSSLVDGDVATVWATTTTRTQRKNQAEPMVLQFSEAYMLVRRSGNWQIAAIADNRQPDNIPVTPSS